MEEVFQCKGYVGALRGQYWKRYSMENSFLLCDTMSMGAETLGGFIRKLRLRGGWNQIELAKEIEMSNRSISEWEADRTIPGRDALGRLARVFQISLEEFRRFLDIDALGDNETLPPEQEERRQQAIKLINELLADSKKLDQWIDYGEWLRSHRENQ
jgi:transcriptional regulator with XRE-family HTH domain